MLVEEFIETLHEGPGALLPRIVGGSLAARGPSVVAGHADVAPGSVHENEASVGQVLREVDDLRQISRHDRR